MSTYNIVWTFSGVAQAMLAVARAQPGQVNFLFSCHDIHRHAQKDGKRYAPLLDPIYEELNAISSCLTIAAPFSNLQGKGCFGDVRNMNFWILVALLRNIISKSVGENPLEDDKVVGAYKKILLRTKPRAVIGIQPSVQLCIAAQALGIVSYDVQHGIISDVNYYNLQKREKYHQSGWPDYILCWDEVSANRVSDLCRGNSRPVVIGNPSYHSPYGRRAHGSYPKNDASHMAKLPCILVTLTYLDYGFRDSFLEVSNDQAFVTIGIPDVLMSLIKTVTSVSWRIRMHPAQKKLGSSRVQSFLAREFSNLPHVDWTTPSNVDLKMALDGCAGHMTVDSAASIDAAQNGVPTILVGCPGWSDKAKVMDYFGDYISSGEMRFVESHELSAHVLKYFSIKKGSAQGTVNEQSIRAFDAFIESLKVDFLG